MPVYALGDLDPDIVVGEHTSIQNGTVLHTTEHWPTVIGDECVVGRASVVSANALVTADTKSPSQTLALGVPAPLRPVDTGEQKNRIDFAVREYREVAAHHHSELRRVDQGEKP